MPQPKDLSAEAGVVVDFIFLKLIIILILTFWAAELKVEPDERYQ